MATVGLEALVTQNLAATPDAGVRTGCCHHWIISNPGGPLSPGTCKFCGERREFNNSLPVREYHKRGDRQPAAAMPVKTLAPAFAATIDIGDAA